MLTIAALGSGTVADFLPASWYFLSLSKAYIEHVLLLELELGIQKYFNLCCDFRVTPLRS